jgi:hypothetical protein
LLRVEEQQVRLELVSLVPHNSELFPEEPGLLLDLRGLGLVMGEPQLLLPDNLLEGVLLILE